MPRPSEPDWFPSRVDPRRTRRIERAVLAIALNGLFLFWAFEWGPLRFEPIHDVLGLVSWGFALAFLVGAYWISKSQLTVRRFVDEQGRQLGVPGAFVEVRYHRMELELGRDTGWLGLDGTGLRFEGVRTCFSLAQTSSVSFPDQVARPGTFVVEVKGVPVTVAILAVYGGDGDQVVTTFRRWPEQGVPGHLGRMPPTTADVRTRTWYLRRAVETSYGSGFLGLGFLLKSLVPKSIPWLRDLVFFAPFMIFLLWIAFHARELRRRDQALLAETFPAQLEVSSPEASPSTAKEVHHVTA